MLPITPIRKTMGQTTNPKIKNTGSSVIPVLIQKFSPNKRMNSA